MRPNLLLLVFLLCGTSIVAQSLNPASSPAAPWLFGEVQAAINSADIRTGTEYTTAEYQSKQSVRLIARKYVTSWLSGGAGIGIGTRKFRLASTYDRYIRENFMPGRPDAITWYNRLEYSDLHLEIPLELRAEVISVGPGAIYLQVGTSWLIPVVSSNSNNRVLENNPEPALMPDAILESPVTNFVNTGIGFVIKEQERHIWYLELTYGRSTSDTVRPVPPDQQDLRSLHFPTLRSEQVGVLCGFSF